MIKYEDIINEKFLNILKAFGKESENVVNKEEKFFKKLKKVTEKNKSK